MVDVDAAGSQSNRHVVHCELGQLCNQLHFFSNFPNTVYHTVILVFRIWLCDPSYNWFLYISFLQE